MRLLTEAAGQVLTRNVVADRRRVLARDQRRRILRTSKRSLGQVDADADGDPRRKSAPKVLGPRTRRTWLTSTS